MLKSGILHPGINQLLARFRHTNRIVIADRGFPYWPMVETIDLALVDGVPTVAQVLKALAGQVSWGKMWMAAEFKANNTAEVVGEFKKLAGGVKIGWEPHVEFKRRVPDAIGLIRTGDTVQYANVILESA